MSRLKLSRAILAMILLLTGLLLDSISWANGITLKNTSDVPMIITSAQLDPSSDKGKICDSSNSNCITSTASDKNTCLSSSDTTNLIKSGETCTLQLNIADDAWGGGELVLKGNFQDDEGSDSVTLPVNVAPANIVFLQSTGSGDSKGCPSQPTADKAKAAPYYEVPDNGYEPAITCIGNYSQFPVHGRIKLKSDEPSDHFNYYVDKSGGCSKDFIPSNTVCKVEIYNNNDNADAGEEGQLVVSGKNMPRKRQNIAFGVKGAPLVMPVNRQYLSQQFQEQMWPGLNFQQFVIDNTASSDTWEMVSAPEVIEAGNPLSLSPFVHVVFNDDAGHLANQCQSSTRLDPGQKCFFWVKVPTEKVTIDSVDRFPPKIGFKDQKAEVEAELTLDGSSTQHAYKVPTSLLTYLYAGGSFLEGGLGEVNTSYLAKYGPLPDNFNKVGWSTVVPFSGNSVVNALKRASNGNLYFGGSFSKLGLPPHPNSSPAPASNVATGCTLESNFGLSTCALKDGNSPASANNVALYDGGQWHPLWQSDAVGTDGTVNTIDVTDEGKVYIGGEFETAGLQHDVGNVAMWQMKQGIPNWNILSANQSSTLAGTDGPVFGLTFYKDGSTPQLLTGGDFDRAGYHESVVSNALWNQQQWKTIDSSKIKTNVDHIVRAFAHFKGKNYITGKLQISNDEEAIGVEENGKWEELLDSSPLDNINTMSGAELELANDKDSVQDYLLIGGSFADSGESGHNLGAYDLDANTFRSVTDKGIDADGAVNAVLRRQLGKDEHNYIFVGGDFSEFTNNTKSPHIVYYTDDDPDCPDNNSCGYHPPADLGTHDGNDEDSGVSGGNVNALAVQSQMIFEPVELTIQ